MKNWLFVMREGKEGAERMSDVARKAALLAIFFYPLDILKFSFFPSLSLYRATLIFAFVFASFSCIIRGRIRANNPIAFVYIVLAAITAIMSYFVSTEPKYAFSEMLNELSGVMIIFVIITQFDENDTDILLKQFVRSAYAGIPFAIVSWFVLFRNPSQLENVCSMGGLFKVDITEELIISCNHMRLTLPYSSSPAYSGVLAATIVILLCDNTAYKPFHRNVLTIIFSLMLILTLSRTGWLALGIFVIIYLVRMSDAGRKTRLVLTGVIVFACVFLSFAGDAEFLRKMLNRIIDDGSKVSFWEDRHFLLPLEGLNIWCSDIKNFLFGIGYGSSININGKWTHIPYFFFNSYVTQIVAKGLSGVVIVCMWLLTKIKLGLLFENRNNYSCKTKANAAFTVLLISSLTYEFYPYYAFYILFSVALLNICSRQSNKNVT